MINIPLSRLLLGDDRDGHLANVPAGMDLATIGWWAAELRKNGDPCGDPITVTAEGDYWRVDDGRHRVVGAWVSGRSSIEAEVVEISEGGES